MVYSIYDSTEQVIQRMIQGSQRMISVNNKNDDSQQEQEPEVRISSAAKRHYELEIETLQNVPRDVKKS